MVKLRRGKSLNDCLQHRNKLTGSQLVALLKHFVKSGSHFIFCHGLMVLEVNG